MTTLSDRLSRGKQPPHSREQWCWGLGTGSGEPGQHRLPMDLCKGMLLSEARKLLEKGSWDHHCLCGIFVKIREKLSLLAATLDACWSSPNPTLLAPSTGCFCAVHRLGNSTSGSTCNGLVSPSEPGVFLAG